MAGAFLTMDTSFLQIAVRRGPLPTGADGENRTDQMTDTVATLPATTLPVALTDRAVRRVARILGAEAPGTALRVSVEGGGCSGFQYKYDLVHEREADDLVLARDGAVVLLDPVTVEHMTGSEIDFVDDLMGQSFQIRNPLATASCGCGVSFAM